MAAVSTNPYPAPTRTPPNLPVYKGRVTLESKIDQLIEMAHLPKHSTRDHLFFMASKMWELTTFISKCGPGNPTLLGNKTLRHPDFREKLRIKTVFEKLIKTVSEVIALRGGVEAFHIIWGARDIGQYIDKNIYSKAKGNESVREIGKYMQQLWNVGQAHHKVLFPNMPPYEKIVGVRYSMLETAVKAGQFFVEEGVNDQILSDQQVYEESKAYAREMSGQIALAQAGVANAYRQVYSGISAPAPAIRPIGVTTANMAWSPSNGASYSATTTPGMTYGYQT